MNVGDWVLCDMKVGQLTELRTVERGEIATINDGTFCSGGIPVADLIGLTVEQKALADEFLCIRTAVLAEDYTRNGGLLHHPDIFGHICSVWLRAARSLRDGDGAGMKAAIQQARDFRKEVHSAMRDIESMKIQGVPIIGRR